MLYRSGLKLEDALARIEAEISDAGNTASGASSFGRASGAFAASEGRASPHPMRWLAWVPGEIADRHVCLNRIFRHDDPRDQVTDETDSGTERQRQPDDADQYGVYIQIAGEPAHTPAIFLFWISRVSRVALDSGWIW